MKYRPEIDGLRALAVLPVIAFHAGLGGMKGGFVGVDVFFVISGFLISTIIMRELEQGRFSLVNFYERRARRILPALFFVILLCLPFAWLWLAPSDLKSFGDSLMAVMAFVSNISFWLESGYFAKTAELKPLLHTWSLAVEEQYYILFPLFLMAFWRFGKTSILTLCVIVCIASLGLSHWAALHKPSANFYLLPTRAWELLLGVFAALYLQNKGHLKSHPINQGLSLLGLGLIIYSILAFDKTTPFPSLYAVLPTLGTVLIIVSAVPNTWVNRVLSFKIFVSIGLISYSAYLWHQPLIAFARHRFLGEPADIILIGLCALSLLLAYVSWRWVEQPFRDKTKTNRKQIFAFSISGMVVFAAIGAGLSLSQGGMFRYDAAQQRVLKNFQSPSDYVVKRFTDIRLKPFDNAKDKKVLIIGDSFAEDLTNAVFEADVSNRVSFSGFRIPNACGVLFVPREDLVDHQDATCRKSPGFYTSPRLLELMKSADEVWVTSNWKAWQMPYMAESITNMKAYNPNIVIYGRKNFGDIREGQFLFEDGIQAWTKPRNMKAEHVFVAQKMREDMPALTQYIDVSQVLCGDETHCVNSDGVDIYSYDGGHLTPYGAKFMGQKLFRHAQN